MHQGKDELIKQMINLGDSDEFMQSRTLHYNQLYLYVDAAIEKSVNSNTCDEIDTIVQKRDNDSKIKLCPHCSAINSKSKRKCGECSKTLTVVDADNIPITRDHHKSVATKKQCAQKISLSAYAKSKSHTERQLK